MLRMGDYKYIYYVGHQPEVFDIKSDVIRTLVELGIEEKNLFVSDNTTYSYHPGRSGSVTLKSEKGPNLAYFGEIHPAIIKKMDCKVRLG